MLTSWVCKQHHMGHMGMFSHQRARVAGAAVLVALVGVLAAAQAMPERLGTGGDAAAYMGVARNILDGRGVTSPYVNELDTMPPAVSAEHIGRAPFLLWPPLYPVSLASASYWGLGPEDAAHVLHLVAIAVAGVFVVLLTSQLSHGSAWAGLAAGLAVVLSGTVQSSVIASYADPLFLALALGSVLLLASVVRTGQWPAVLAFVCTAAAATMTRYVGFGLVIGGVGCVLTDRALRWRTRTSFVAAIAAAAAPAAAWLLYVRSQVPNELNRSRVTWRGDIWSGFVEALAQWIAPERLPAWWKAMSLIAVVLLVLPVVLRAVATRLGSTRRSGEHTREAAAAWLASAWLAFGLLAVIAGSAMTIGAQLSVNGRMLLVIQALVIAWVAAGAAASIRTLRGIGSARPVMLGLVAIPLVVVLAGIVWVGVLNADRPFTSPLVAEATPADAARLAETLRTTNPIFANSPTELYVLTERGSAPLPQRFHPATNEPNAEYERELIELRALVLDRGGAVVLFASAQVYNPNLPTELDFTDAQPGRWESLSVSPGVTVLRPSDLKS